MACRIVRTDPATGAQTLVAGYDNIPLCTALGFLHDFAQKEVDEGDYKREMRSGQTHIEFGDYTVTRYAVVLFDHDNKFRAKYSLECPLPATYTSVFDGAIVTSTPCNYYLYNKEATDIEPADSQAAENANALTDEYVTLPDGTRLRDKDGVTFDY